MVLFGNWYFRLQRSLSFSSESESSLFRVASDADEENPESRVGAAASSPPVWVYAFRRVLTFCASCIPSRPCVSHSVFNFRAGCSAARKRMCNVHCASHRLRIEARRWQTTSTTTTTTTDDSSRSGIHLIAKLTVIFGCAFCDHLVGLLGSGTWLSARGERRNA